MAALCRLLLDRGLCDAKTIERAQRIATESGQRLDRVLTQLGLVSERSLAEGWSALLGSVWSAEMYPATPLFTEELKPKFLRKVKVLPLLERADSVVLAMADPLDVFTCRAVAAALDRKVELMVAVPIELDAAIDPPLPRFGQRRVVDRRRPRRRDCRPSRRGHRAAERPGDEAPVIRLVNQMIARAVETQASDIHIEPFEDRAAPALPLRRRAAGGGKPAAALAAAIISRIKIMGRLDIAERRLPQDGRSRLAVRGQEVDFRVSTVPRCMAKRWCCACSTAAPWYSTMPRSACPERVIERLRAGAANCPTASCW